MIGRRAAWAPCWSRSPALLASFALAACGSDLGSGDDHDSGRGRGRLDHARRGRAADDLDRAASTSTSPRAPSTARARRSTSSPRRPGSTSSTWRTSTRTSRSSRSCARSSRTAPSGGRDIIVATDWMARRYHDLGYLQDIDQSRDAERREEPAAAAAAPRVRPGPLVHGPVPERDDRADRAHRPGAGHHLDQRPLRPQVQGQGGPALRAPRHGAAGDEGRGDRPRDGDQGAVAGRRSTRSRAPSTRARSAT